MSNSENTLEEFIKAYREFLRASFDELWNCIPVEPDKLEAYSVVGALVSRQVTLSMEMATAPSTWNGHSAPLFLRAMTDLHITLSWILSDLAPRARLYILHGLGEAKLTMGHYQARAEEATDDSETREQMMEMVERHKGWINSQRPEFMVEVNLGNWAKLDYRKMAQECGNEDLYNFAYKPFSQAAHSMWPHVAVYNSRHCTNPLHRFHLVPDISEAPFEPDFMYRSCKYVDKAFRSLIERFAITFAAPLPLEWWNTFWDTEEAGEIQESEKLMEI